ncbi:MAG: RNA polymerase factor sigma-54 [Lautropia sp.]
MRQSLNLRQSQHLALTPQLQQSIRLLQMSTLELNQEIEQILAQNPLLERLDDPLQAHQRLNADGSLRQEAGPGDGEDVLRRRDGSDLDGGADAPGSRLDADAYDAFGGLPGALPERPRDGADERAADPSRDDGVGDRADGAEGSNDGLDGLAWGAEGSGRGSGDDGDDDRGLEQVGVTGTTLREYLVQQLAGVRCTARDRALTMLLIEELDDGGFIRSSLEELLETLPPEAGIEIDELKTALSLLQSFEPAGIGARSVAECLLLQLPQAAARCDAPADTVALARAILTDHLDLLAGREFGRLRKMLHCDEAGLRAAQRLILTLDPRPASRYGDADATYVVPDIVVRRTRAGWQARLNPDVMPKLKVNDMYARILKSQRPPAGRPVAAGASPNTPANGAGAGVANGAAAGPDNGPAGGNSLSSHLQEARWLVKNVQQRFETILKVSQEIVDRQKAFFSHGAVAMRPLVLREIADAVGLHESTISRVTTHKYMLTPFGTVELKYFFGSHVATDTGGAASSTAIRALLKQLIEEEDRTQPLSDSRLAELLGEQGIVVARRTVAKYRESLRIAPVAQRKAL